MNRKSQQVAEAWQQQQQQHFSSRQHCITPGALAKLGILDYPPQLLLSRHFACDWQELDVHDIEQNRWALRNDARVLSAYTIEQTRFWVLTEADRSVTTILLPSEY